MAAEQAWGEQFGKILMRRVTQATGWDEPREESGRAAWLALEELQKRLEGHAYSTAQDMPSAQWLWYLRRLGWLFEGRTQYPASGETMEECQGLTTHPDEAVRPDMRQGTGSLDSPRGWPSSPPGGGWR